MSSPFINRVLFGHGSKDINQAYMDGLKRFMYTSDYVVEPTVVISTPTDLDKIAHPEPYLSKPTSNSKRFTPAHKNTLFWSIFLAVHEYPEYMEASRKSGNREIEEKLRIVESLKPFPKRLKDTNSKLTLEGTQALYGSLMTSRDDRLEFCVAYAAHYNKTIWIMYPKTYRVYSPTVQVQTNAEDAIILWATPGPKHSVIYSLDQDPNTVLDELLRTREPGLRSQSTYKMDELIAIAHKLGVVVPAKKPKKSELYNEIRLYISKDLLE